MKKVVCIFLLVFIVGCSSSEDGDLIKEYKEDRAKNTEKTMKNERENLEKIGVDTNKPMDLKEIMKKTNEYGMKKSGE